MKTKIKFFLAVLIAVLSLSSCSKSETTDEFTTYSMGFTEMSVSGSISDNYMGVIESAYKTALGVTSTSFEWPGGVDDAAVKAKCTIAEQSLSGKVLNGTYTFQISRGTNMIYTHTFTASK
jgi:hypothetical protein